MKLRDLKPNRAGCLFLAYGYYTHGDRLKTRSWFMMGDNNSYNVADELAELGLLKRRFLDGIAIYRITRSGRDMVERAIFDA